MSTAKHTALPWRVVGRAIENENCRCVADLCRSNSRATAPDAELDANAAFIVRACNSHEELVAACEAGLHDLQEIANYVRGMESTDGDHSVKYVLNLIGGRILALQSALAKAKAKGE